MEALHRQVLPFLLRRLKEDVLQDLPPKIIQDYYCDLSPLQVSVFSIRVVSNILINESPYVHNETNDITHKPLLVCVVFIK